MKKKLALLSICFIFVLSVFAEGDFSFTFMPKNTLYPNYYADQYSTDTTLGIIIMQDVHVNTDRVKVNSVKASDGRYENVFLNTLMEEKWGEDNIFFQGRLGFNSSIMRFSYKDIIATEFQAKAAFNTVFDAFGGTDLETFDGIVNFAVNVQLYDSIVLHAGLFHYSGHTGDETLENLTSYLSNIAEFDDDYVVTNQLDYCNDNLRTVGLSVTPFNGLRLFSELQWLPKECAVGPKYICRNNQLSKSGHPQTQTADYPDYYKGYISISGIDYELKLSNDFALYVGTILKLHQNGQVNTDYTYSPERSWEMEKGATIGLKGIQSGGGASTNLYISYYDGRFPGTVYFNLRVKYVQVGVVIST